MRPEDDSRPEDERLLEAIDVCRPGSDDHQLPETAFLGKLLDREPARQRLFERVQRLDATIEQAIDRVPVPAGLEDRLLAALAAARETALAESGKLVAESQFVDAPGTEIDSAASSPQEAYAPSVRPPLRRRTSRRVWLVSGLATAAALLVGYWFWPANEYTHEAVMAFGQDYFSTDMAQAAWGTGTPLATKQPPAGYRLSRFVNARANPQWRSIKSFLGRNGIAYDLQLGDTRATLYVVKVAGTPKAPHILPGASQAPLRHPASSGVRPTDAWTESGFLYVLVVDGNEQDYQQFISSGGAVT